MALVTLSPSLVALQCLVNSAESLLGMGKGCARVRKIVSTADGRVQRACGDDEEDGAHPFEWRITSDPLAVVGSMSVDHPVGDLLTDVATSHRKRFHGSGKFLMVLSSRLANEAHVLEQQGMERRVVVKAWQDAVTICKALCSSVSVKVDPPQAPSAGADKGDVACHHEEGDMDDEEVDMEDTSWFFEATAQDHDSGVESRRHSTPVDSVPAHVEEQEPLAQGLVHDALYVQAAMAVALLSIESQDEDWQERVLIARKTRTTCCITVHNGVIVPVGFHQTPSLPQAGHHRLKQSEAICVNRGESSVSFEGVQQLLKQLTAHNIGLIIARDKIEVQVKDCLASEGLLVLDGVGDQTIRTSSRLLGITAAESLRVPFGYHVSSGGWELKPLQGDSYEGEYGLLSLPVARSATRNTYVLSLLVCGPPMMLDDLIYNLWQAARKVERAWKEGKVLLGGVWERQCADKLRKVAEESNADDLSQLHRSPCLEAFANALDNVYSHLPDCDESTIDGTTHLRANYDNYSERMASLEASVRIVTISWSMKNMTTYETPSTLVW